MWGCLHGVINYFDICSSTVSYRYIAERDTETVKVLLHEFQQDVHVHDIVLWHRQILASNTGIGR